MPVAPAAAIFASNGRGRWRKRIAHLQEQGVPIELGPIATRGVKGEANSVYFRDPDGSLLEFMSYSKDQ